jgi:hypothetical protein
MPSGIFHFPEQSRRHTYTIEIDEMRSYDAIMVDRTRPLFGAVSYHSLRGGLYSLPRKAREEYLNKGRSRLLSRKFGEDRGIK